MRLRLRRPREHMIPPRVGLVAVAVLATALAPRRHSLRPVAATLCALAAVNVLHSDAAIPARVDVALWLAWPGITAALAWQAWRSHGWPPVALAFALYALAVPWAPWSWSAHPVAWWVASRVPHAAAVVVAVVAWALAPKMPRTPAQAVATLLAISGALDLVVGALAPGAGWVRAAPLAWATWGACAVAVGWESVRGRASP